MPKSIARITKTFHVETPMICLQTNLVMTGLFSLYGIPLVTESRGGSVARARAANVSIIKLTQRSWTAERGDSPMKIPPRRTTRTQEMLTVT